MITAILPKRLVRVREHGSAILTQDHQRKVLPVTYRIEAVPVGAQLPEDAITGRIQGGISLVDLVFDVVDFAISLSVGL